MLVRVSLICKLRIGLDNLGASLILSKLFHIFLTLFWIILAYLSPVANSSYIMLTNYVQPFHLFFHLIIY